MYLHLNLLSYEQLFYIRTCTELKQDPFSRFILPLSNFTYCCIKLQNFQKARLVLLSGRGMPFIP